MPLSRRDALLAAGAGIAAGGAGLAIAAPARAADAPPASYPLRLTGMPLRDPYVVADRASGLYHLYVANAQSRSGVAGAGTMVYRSPDLTQWSTPTVVYQPAAESWAMNGGWAPEVHRWRGRWYLFTTLHNPDMPIPQPKAGPFGIPVQIPQYLRGTTIAVADSLLGPFTALDTSKPVARADFMTLDGTLFEDEKGKPWMVYAHEWIQKIDGTMEAVPLKADLTGTAGKPIHLFKGSDATWLAAQIPSPSANQILPYVTDGPELYRLPGGGLAMLWSTYEKNITNPDGTISGHYVQTVAVSPSGRLQGPWVQGTPLLRKGAGHGMIFRTLATKGHPSRPMLILHQGTKTTHAKLYEIELQKRGPKLGKHRKDLDGS